MLEIKNLIIHFNSYGKKLTVLKGLSYTLKQGATLCVVGESGCGKTVHALSILRLLDPNAEVEGEINFDGKNILQMSARELQKIRGARVSMVFQDPVSSLNPVLSVGSQLIETLLAHNCATKFEAAARAAELLKNVGIEQPEQMLKRYPHEFSGGQRQRIMIAMALACSPDVLIADEPTTALDVTIQKQIISLLKNLQKKYGMALIFITHNLGLVSEIGGDVLVLYAGQMAEHNLAKNIFAAPLHPYTRGLLNSAKGLEEGSKELEVIEGNPPAAGAYFEGCPFEPRCKEKFDKCRYYNPPLFKGPHGQARCWLLEKKAPAQIKDAGSAPVPALTPE